MSKAKVLIIGFGGVGAIAGFGLEYADKSEVTAVIRSDFQLAVKKGYTIESCDYGNIEGYRPAHIVQTPEQAKLYGPFDFVVVTTKNHPEILRVEDLISPVITSDKTVIVLAQNGIGIDEPVIKKFPGTVVLSGISMISSNNYGGVSDQTSHS